MAAITISREIGSLGCEVARRAAEQLGFQVVQRELVNQAARRSRVPEAALAAIDDLGLIGIRPSPRANRAYREAVQQVIDDFATQGNVIISHTFSSPETPLERLQK